MSKFIDGMREADNYTYTENGAVTYKSTLNDLYDLFALGGAYRTHSEEDIITLFSNAYKEDPEMAMKCLFYLRDAREGQGERRFFRTCMHWLAKSKEREAAKRNMIYINEFGRWDDLYCFIDTPLQDYALEIMRQQLAMDMSCKTPSLLAKWLKSENSSSKETIRLANITRKYFGMTHKQYRRTLSVLRGRINVLEKLMSENRWDEIEFDKIPSRAGLIYRNAFARKDILKERYKKFAENTNTKVNAQVTYPYECVNEAAKVMNCGDHYRWFGDEKIDSTQRAIVNKYWDNLKDYFHNASFNGMAIVDTSGSMIGLAATAPINIAVSLGLYCAERAKGPYQGYFISFESNPHLVRVKGQDFCEKVKNAFDTPWGGSTNLEATFDLILNVALNNRLKQEDIPQNLIIISDMEFNSACRSSRDPWLNGLTGVLMEQISSRWSWYGYKMPKLIFWNVEARQNNIPMREQDGVTFVSGMSPVIYEMIMSGKTSQDLMMDKLMSDRYTCIH